MANRGTLIWKTLPPNTRSVFSEEVAQRLATKHKLLHDNVLALGMDLMVAMTWHSEEPDDRKVKVLRKAGNKRRETARMNIEQAELALHAALEEISGLEAEDAAVLGAFDRRPDSWSLRLTTIATELAQLRRDLAYSSRLEHALVDPSANDKRLNRDDVRINVLNTIFLFWREQRDRLSVTTRPDRIRDTVTGPLVDFARDVVAELTMSNRLSADTLKADLRKARDKLEEFDAALPLSPPKAL